MYVCMYVISSICSKYASICADVHSIEYRCLAIFALIISDEWQNKALKSINLQLVENTVTCFRGPVTPGDVSAKL